MSLLSFCYPKDYESFTKERTFSILHVDTYQLLKRLMEIEEAYNISNLQLKMHLLVVESVFRLEVAEGEIESEKHNHIYMHLRSEHDVSYT